MIPHLFIVMLAEYLGGEELNPVVPHACYHIYNDPELRGEYAVLIKKLERNKERHDEDLLANLLIIMHEPIYRVKDEDYHKEHRLFWRDTLLKTELITHSGFVHYFK